MDLAKLTSENVWLPLILVFPGFMSLRTYQLFVRTERKPLGDQLIEAIAFSMVNLGLLLPLIWIWVQVQSIPWRPSVTLNDILGFSFVGLFVTPILLGYGAFRIRVSSLPASIGIVHPTPGGWDFFFARQRAPCLVTLRLKSGRYLGGYFGAKSFASSFPNREDLYLERTLIMDQDSGQYTGFIPNSNGMLVGRDDCDWIEFHDIEDAP